MVTLITDTLAPNSGFQYNINSTQGIITINSTQQVITVPLQNGTGSVPVQALMWDATCAVQPGEEVSLTFVITIPANSTTGATTNYAAANYRDDTEQLLYTEVKNAAEIDIYQESSGGGLPPEVEPSPRLRRLSRRNNRVIRRAMAVTPALHRPTILAPRPVCRPKLPIQR